MEFKVFKENVERWAQIRGIYDQSTEEHQQAKAIEEIGEYLTATTDEERMDSIGDIAVCIVNAAYFRNGSAYLGTLFDDDLDGMPDVAYCVIRGDYSLALGELSVVSFSRHGKPFELCIEAAWYVKWENLTEEQREEFNRRDHGNTLIRQ